jgi:PST family polysaccharide transporter
MIDSLKGKYERNKTLVDNFNFMSILQVSQILFPLLIYPYLIRVLGKETYGVVAYSNAIVAYLLMLINFGFNISEIKEISVLRDQKGKVSEIVSSVLIIRTLLFVAALIVLIICVFAIPFLREHKWLYLAYSGLLINAALNPGFYFLGIEKMKFITFISIIASLIFLVLTMILVRKPSQYVLVPLFTSIGSLTGTIIGLYIMFVREKVRFVFQKADALKAHFKESLPFFTSRVSVLVIDKTNFVLLGSFVGYVEVAYYDLAAKFLAVMLAPVNVFVQVLFPNVSRTRNISLVIKTFKMLLAIYILGYFSLFLLGEPLIKIIGGIELVPARFVLYILAITAITDLIGTFLGTPVLLATGHRDKYNRSIIYGSFFYAISVLFLYFNNWIGLYQLAALTVCTSIFVLIYRLYFCRIYKLV